MEHLKKDEVVAICYDGNLFHLHCYDENIDNVNEDFIVTKDALDQEEWYFCDKCGQLIYFSSHLGKSRATLILDNVSYKEME